jgi:uncharacterized RDD family membrane protein YckC
VSASLPDQQPCVNCGQAPGFERACRVCRQVTGMPAGITTTSAKKRLGGFLLDVVLFIATLGIGYLVWTLIVYRSGRSPAKQLLGMRVIKTKDDRPSGWWRMVAREFFKGLLLTVLVSAFWILWDYDNQELWDKMAETLVVDWPPGVPVPSVTPLPGETTVYAAGSASGSR